MKKITTIALTGALALGALGMGSMADLPGQSNQAFAATSADVAASDAFINISSASPNVVSALIGINGDLPALADFRTKHQARFIITNSVGAVVKSGSFNPWEEGNGGTFADYTFSSFTNISLAGLPKNASQYRITLSIPLDDTTGYTEANTDWSHAFQYNADGTLSNFRD